METEEEPGSAIPSSQDDFTGVTAALAETSVGVNCSTCDPECRSEAVGKQEVEAAIVEELELELEEGVGVAERGGEGELAGETGSVVAEASASEMEAGVDECEDWDDVAVESDEIRRNESGNVNEESVMEGTENEAAVSKEEREFVEEMLNIDGVDNVVIEDEVKGMRKEDVAAGDVADTDVVAENIENEKVVRKCVDDATEGTASVSRRTEMVEKVEMGDVLDEKYEVGKQEDEFNEVEKGAGKVNDVVDEDDKLNLELKGGELKLNEVAEDDQKLNEAEEDTMKVDTEEKDGKMGRADSKLDEEVNESEGEEGNDEEINKVAEEDHKLNEVEEDIVKVDTEEKDGKMEEADSEQDEEEVNESEGEEGNDEELVEVAEEDQELNESEEEVAEVDTEEEDEMDGSDSKQDKEVNESEGEEDNDEEMNEVAEEDENVDEEGEEEEDDDDGDDETINEAEDAEEGDVKELSVSGSGKRKREKDDEGVGKAPLKKKKMEEDVCFICFDGGELVLCDRRGCDKAYHPSCVDHDEAFFKGKGKWYCGWHLCSKCEKNAYYKCYTCAFSLCKGCIKDGVFFCVRSNKGFCEACFRIVKLIEMNEQGDKDTPQVDFDDKSCWEYLFKDYWIDLKEWLSITPDELAMAKHPRKGSDKVATKQDSSEELYDSPNDGGSASDGSAGNAELTTPKGRKGKKRLKSRVKESASPSKKTVKGVGASSDKIEWASKELLDFVMHMKKGDTSVHSQFDVQALLLDYIKKNKLRDPRRKSQILCDSRLQHLFGKHRVAHFEMLKLLESHFLLKQDQLVDDHQGSIIDSEAKQLESDGISDALVKSRKDKKQKSRKRGYRRGLQSNIDDYAAIDTHNINLIYLKRSLVEDLLEDSETFEHKVVGSFMRLRIPGNANKQDLYRLVQIIGTKGADKPYRVGKRTTSFLLEILNLKRIELVSVDAISNQEFTEEECKRLRQSIKLGLLNRLTVGDIQEKAIALQAVRVRDTMESEITRLCHLRDRASDMGKIKELRESVEKLQLLKSPEERKRRLEKIPEIHVDPNMDPSHESEEDDDETDDKRRDNHLRPRGSSSGFSRRERDPISPMKIVTSPYESYGGKTTSRELTRNLSDKDFSYKGDDRIGSNEKANDSFRDQGRDNQRSTHPAVAKDSIPKAAQEISPAPPSTTSTQPASKVDETQKNWHYKDPAGKVQGPFSIVQLRKWSNAGYFPANLRIWRATEKADDSILLTDALVGNFQPPMVVQTARLSSASENDSSSERSVPTTLNSAVDRRNSEASLPSPSPASTGTRRTMGQARKSRWSPTPAQAVSSQQFDANPNGSQSASASTSNSQLSHHTTVTSNLSSSGNAPHVQVNSSVPSAAVALDTAALQSLVQTISNNQLQGTQGTGGAVPVSRPENNGSNTMNVPQTWGTAPLHQQYNSTPVPPQNNPYGNWGNAATGIHNSAASFPTANPAPVPSVQGAPSGMVPFVQPQWGMGGANNPSMGWMGNHPPGNLNQGWVAAPPNQATVPANANVNHGWVAAPPNQAAMIPPNTNPGWMQAQVAYGNANTGWSPGVHVQGWGPPAPLPGQGSAPINANQNPGWSGPGNVTNPGWGAPPPPGGNMVNNWRNNGGDGGDRGSQGGVSSGRGDRQWNRQSGQRA
ncbi:Zinc finger CCCH domain-containing protein 19 [Linum perenne]